MNALVIVLFLVVFGLCLLAAGLGFRYVDNQRKKRLTGVLETVTDEIRPAQIHVLIEPSHEAGGAVKQVLGFLNLTKRLETALNQSGLGWTLDRLMITMFLTFTVGALAGLKFPYLLGTALSVLGFGLVAGVLPWFFVKRAGRRRMAQFEEQFPEALDLLARALRAGHAFPVSLEMLGTETADPLRTEFSKVFNEQNLGESLSLALTHLADRVPLVDVRFFVSAVLMQRETGGNLGEILSRLSAVIRDRFRLKGQVKALSAHGRITSSILTVMPLLTAAGMSGVAPDYLPSMIRDPFGKYLVIGCLGAQVVGYMIMKKIINIKV